MDAILILLSFGEFIKVMEMLFKLGQVDRALLLLESCIEFGLLSLDDDTNRIFSFSLFTIFVCSQSLYNVLSLFTAKTWSILAQSYYNFFWQNYLHLSNMFVINSGLKVLQILQETLSIECGMVKTDLKMGRAWRYIHSSRVYIKNKFLYEKSWHILVNKCLRS